MPYTDHGHWYGPGPATQPGPQQVARCGGIGLCAECAREAGWGEVQPARPPARAGWNGAGLAAKRLPGGSVLVKREGDGHHNETVLRLNHETWARFLAAARAGDYEQV